MNDWLERALRGERQVVFVTGEPGIGKTTLVSAVHDEAAARGIWMAWGQCLEQYGAGEAYLPVLDGLSRLARTAGAERITELLRRHAPTWLLELPSLIAATERETLRQQVVGASRERMLRELADAIEAITADTPLMIVLEDLHWSDYSTLDLIAYLARRRDADSPHRHWHLSPRRRDSRGPSAEGGQTGVAGTRSVSGAAAGVSDGRGGRAVPGGHVARSSVSEVAAAPDSPPHRRQSVVHGESRRVPGRRTDDRPGRHRLDSGRRVCGRRSRYSGKRPTAHRASDRST